MKRLFSWAVTLTASLVLVAFPLVMGAMLVIVGCSSVSQGHDNSGGSGGADVTASSSASSSSTASSSSGDPVPACAGDEEIPPGYGEGGGYYEDGVLACYRFVPKTYPFAVAGFTAKYPTSVRCSQAPAMVWAIGKVDQLEGLSWSSPVPAQAGGSGTLEVKQSIADGEAFWACLKLASKGVDQRSCAMGCYFDSTGQNGDFFWGDTYPPDGTMAGGHTIDPPVLEPLSMSPTGDLAALLGNDKAGLRIEVFGGP
jgi:hypothetical protein